MVYSLHVSHFPWKSDFMPAVVDDFVHEHIQIWDMVMNCSLPCGFHVTQIFLQVFCYGVVLHPLSEIFILLMTLAIFLVMLIAQVSMVGIIRDNPGVF